MERFRGVIRSLKEIATGIGNGAPIVRHYPKDDQRRDLHEEGTGRDTGYVIPLSKKKLKDNKQQ